MNPSQPAWGHLMVKNQYPIAHIPPPLIENSMPEVTIRSVDPVQMYWRMVFYGAADADNELVITSKDEETGIFTVFLKTD